MEGSQVVACVFASDGAADAALRALAQAGVTADRVKIGAADARRAQAVAERAGVLATLDVHDPLGDVGSLAGEERASASIDRGGVIGALFGIVAGLGLGFTPLGAFTPVPPGVRPLADALLLFALGAVAGASLGGALGPRRSTHVAYRIVDAIDEGSIGVTAEVPSAVVEAALKALEAAGGTDIIKVPLDG